ncbi:MAG TPA: hypothetical protein VJ993_00290 [Woeseiaceae bacterium]|nr:hypothetical protein [Woeseiaceae bacterium]
MTKKKDCAEKAIRDIRSATRILLEPGSRKPIEDALRRQTEILQLRQMALAGGPSVLPTPGFTMRQLPNLESW